MLADFLADLCIATTLSAMMVSALVVYQANERALERTASELSAMLAACGARAVEQLLKWGFAWAQLINGAMGVITLGQYNAGLPLRAAKTLARWRHRKEGQ